MSTFSFSFSGDDIEDINTNSDPSHHDFLPAPNHFAETGTLHRATNSPSAFPISGQALLPPNHHDLQSMLSVLPSKISYSTLIVNLDGGDEVRIPRRELWDVRVQLMAEEDEEEQLGNLGKDDVRTGIYEGGFKSWESSVDLVRVLEGRRPVSGGFLEVRFSIFDSWVWERDVDVRYFSLAVGLLYLLLPSSSGCYRMGWGDSISV
jgi:protein-histidine N-methyltransferase